MRVRTLATTAALAAIGLTSLVPANAAVRKPAAPKALVFKDLVGDGNAVNDQGLGLLPAGTATPADADALDIRSVTLVTDKAGTGATKIIATLELGAAPFTSGLYRILSSLGGQCFWTEATFSPGGVLDGAAIRVCDDSTTGYTYYDSAVKVSGSKLIWTIPIKSFKSAGLKPGAVLDGLGADARLSEGAITAPSVDTAASDAVYKVGQ
jgi:hypothetical protein